MRRAPSRSPVSAHAKSERPIWSWSGPRSPELPRDSLNDQVIEDIRQDLRKVVWSSVSSRRPWMRRREGVPSILDDPNPPKRDPRSCAARIDRPSRSSPTRPRKHPGVPHPERFTGVPFALASADSVRNRTKGLADRYSESSKDAASRSRRRSSTIAPAEGSCRARAETRVSGNSPAG